MLSPEQKAPIAVSLFVRVDEYATSIEDGKVLTDKPLQMSTPIVIFCLNFFDQFFVHVVGTPVGAPSDSAKQKAAALRIAQPTDAVTVRQLIALFERLCELWDGALGFTYTSTPDEIIEFNQRYIPRLLTAIKNWARSATPPQDAVAHAADRVAAHFQSALMKSTHRG